MKDFTPEQATQRLFKIASTGEGIEQIPNLVEARGNIHALNENGDTLIYVAASSNQAGAIKALAPYGPDVNKLCLEGCYAPLHIAAQWDYVCAIEALVAAGADVNMRDGYGDTPIHKALNPETITVLAAAGANLDRRDACGITAAQYHKKESVAALIVNGAKDPGRYMDEPIVKTARDIRSLLTGTISFTDLLQTPGFFIDNMRQCLNWLADSPKKQAVMQQVAERDNQFEGMLNLFVPRILYAAEKLPSPIDWDWIFQEQPFKAPWDIERQKLSAQTNEVLASHPEYRSKNFIRQTLLNDAVLEILYLTGQENLNFYKAIFLLCDTIIAEYPEQLPQPDLDKIDALGKMYRATYTYWEQTFEQERLEEQTQLLEQEQRVPELEERTYMKQTMFEKRIQSLEQEQQVPMLKERPEMLEQLQTGALTVFWSVHTFNSVTGFVKSICPECFPEQTGADGFFGKYIQNSGGIILSGVKWAAEASLISSTAYLMGPGYAAKVAGVISANELGSFVLANAGMQGAAQALTTSFLLVSSYGLNPLTGSVCLLLEASEALNIVLGDSIPSQQDIKQSVTIGVTVFMATLLQGAPYLFAAASTLSPLGIVAASLAALTVSAQLGSVAAYASQKILAHTSDDSWIAKQIPLSNISDGFKGFIYATADAMRDADEYVMGAIGLTKSPSEEFA